LLSGSTPTGQGDFRTHLPRFSGDNLNQNAKLINALRHLAGEKGLQPSQLAVAWVLAKSRRIIPVIGARSRKQLAESLAAVHLTLSASEMAHIEENIPASAVAGSRYDERQMNMLDSERA
jgi:aryl-alcohol dehydrogenase-like predicted oxidoreductase